MSGKGQIILADWLLQQSPLVGSLINNLVVLPQPIAREAGEVGVEAIAGTFLTFEWVVAVVLFGRVFASEWSNSNLQGGLQVLTLKSLRRTSQYIPHSSGLVGTNLYFLHAHS